MVSLEGNQLFNINNLKRLMEGLGVTLNIAIISLIISTILGIVFGIIMTSRIKSIKIISAIYLKKLSNVHLKSIVRQIRRNKGKKRGHINEMEIYEYIFAN